mgnify:FL=1
MGIETLVLSGDREEAVASIAGGLGINYMHGGLNPKDKADLIADLQRKGFCVAMVCPSSDLNRWNSEI